MKATEALDPDSVGDRTAHFLVTLHFLSVRLLWNVEAIREIHVSTTFDDEALQAAEEVARLVVSKQRDYGSDNILKCPVGAELGIAVRLYDKIARLSNLVQSGAEPSNESLKDTADDIIGYGLVLKMVLDGTFTLPLKDK